MAKRQTKRPTRRKPSRPNKHDHYYSTIPDYSPPWTIWASGFAIAIIPLAIITVAAYGHIHGWW